MPHAAGGTGVASTVYGLVINGFGGLGLDVFGRGSVVQGNSIGTNVARTAAKGNGVGMLAWNDNVTIGGSTTQERERDLGAH